MFSNLKKRFLTKEALLIATILLIGFFMRIYRINEYQNFLGDEGRDVLVVKHILDGDLTLLGPTASVGSFFLGPAYYYFMTPFLWIFNYDPVGPAIMVALFGVATIYLLYHVAKEFYNRKSAACAALLYAISPLVIIYSRSSWNPNIVPFFSLAFLYALYKGVVKKSFKLILFTGFLFGILLQLHYLATFLGVIAFFYLLITVFYSVKKSFAVIYLLKQYVIFAAGVFIGWLPFLLFEVRHGFQNIQSIFRFVFASGETGGNGKYFEIANDVFFRTFGRLIFAFPKPEELQQYSRDILQLWGVSIYVVIIACISTSIFFLVKNYKKKNNIFYQQLLLLLWFGIGVMLFGFYKKQIYDYYLGFLYPVPFLFLAGFLSILFKKGKIIFTATIVVLIGIIILNLHFRPFKIQGNNQVNQARVIADVLISKTDGKPFNFAVLSDGGNSDHAYRYFLEVRNRKPVTIQFPGVDPERKSVTDQLLIVCESNPCYPLGNSLWEVAGFGQAEIVGVWDASIFKVYKLKHSSIKY